MPSNYTQRSYISNYLLINIAASFDSQINKWAEAVTRWIDNYTGTSFEEEDTYKLYDGDGTRDLMIDDLLTLTKVEILDDDGDVDDTLDSTSEYYLYPANKTPKNRIRINTANAPIAVYPSGHQNIKVTGTFGNTSTIPEDIRLAATMLVAAIIRDSQTDLTGKVETERLGEYSVTFQDISDSADRLKVKDLLNYYRHIPV